jgi:hypothetical protein
MKVKDINWTTIKEWDIVNYYTCEPLEWYKLEFRWTHKIIKDFNWKLCLYQWPNIDNKKFNNWIALYAYQIISNINIANKELLEKVKWI